MNNFRIGFNAGHDVKSASGGSSESLHQIENYKYSAVSKKNCKPIGNKQHLSKLSSEVLKLSVKGVNIRNINRDEKGSAKKPAVPPKPCHLKISDKWTKRVKYEESKDQGHRPKRKGNSLPVTSFSSPLIAEDRNKGCHHRNHFKMKT